MTDRLSNFGYTFQIKIITSLFADKVFMQQISDILLPTYFESEANQWIVDTILEYGQEYKSSPTLEVMKVKLEDVDNDILKTQIIDHLKDAWKYVGAEDLEFIKEQAINFCRNQEIKKAILDSVPLLNKGEYEAIKGKIDAALKAGGDKDIGHEYMTSIDERYTESVRFPQETPWDVINDLTDGGLGKGELGVMVAPAGIGKCVGPKTLVDIEYEQIGIEIQSQSGKQIVLWLDPWEEFQIDDDIILKGYQIEMLLESAAYIGKPI